MFYGFDYLENPSLQLPSTVYQNFLNCSGKEGELYYVPIFEINLIKDITIIEETKDFGDGLQSQLTMTVDDGDVVKVYFTVLYDDTGSHFKFLDFEPIG